MNQQNTNTPLRILQTSFWPDDEKPVVQDTHYLASQSDLIEKSIVPPDFFNFRGRVRVCGVGWYGKKKPSQHKFPKGVQHIHVEKRAGGLWLAMIRHEPNKPPYIPHGKKMPAPQQRPRMHARPDDAVPCEDHKQSGSLIGSGVHQRDEDAYTVSFSGSKEQLIASGLVTATMFPDGMTAAGKERTKKRSPRNSPVSWLVTKDEGDTWMVYFYNSITHDNAMLYVREAYLNAVSRGMARRSRKDDDDDD